MALFRKKQSQAKNYDPEKQSPVIRSSICTGEKTAGFLDKETGTFHDVMLIRNPGDLEDFRQQFGIREEIKTIY